MTIQNVSWLLFISKAAKTPTMSSSIDLTLSSDDEGLPPSSGLSRKQPSPWRQQNQRHHIILAQLTNQSLLRRSRFHRKRKQAYKAFTLIWQRTSQLMAQERLKVYPNKDAAEQAKREVMSQYHNCGHGDIMVGDCCRLGDQGPSAPFVMDR